MCMLSWWVLLLDSSQRTDTIIATAGEKEDTDQEEEEDGMEDLNYVFISTLPHVRSTNKNSRFMFIYF